MMPAPVPKIMPIPQKISPNWTVVDHAVIDGEQWYRVRVYRTEIMGWINQQDPAWRVDLKETVSHGCQWDVHEKLLTVLSLRWA